MVKIILTKFANYLQTFIDIVKKDVVENNKCKSIKNVEMKLLKFWPSQKVEICPSLKLEICLYQKKFKILIL